MIGLDTRLGKTRGRADALHLVTIFPDSARVLIRSIPRGTPYPLGYESPSANIISSVRSARGRDALLRAVAKLCRVDRIPYYVELGFSQAVGVLRLLGYGDPMQELQALRMRKGYTRGDIDRCLNQGRFLRHAFPRVLGMFEGLSGELLLSAALEFVDTNMDKEFCLGMLYALNDAGFHRGDGVVSQTVVGVSQKRQKDASLPVGERHAVSRADYSRFTPTVNTRAERTLRTALEYARMHESQPASVVAKLWPMFLQHGWQQIPSGETRAALRDSMAIVLKRSFVALRDGAAVRKIDAIIHSDNVIFRTGSF